MPDSKSYIDQSEVIASFLFADHAPVLEVRTYVDMLFLVCADHHTRGCQHVKFAFEQSLDSKLFEYALPTSQVEIPISTMDGLWEYVEISDAHPQFGYREVHWKNPYDQKVSLGVLNYGDGRRVVQDMLFEYAYADILAREKCINSLHGAIAEQHWKNIMELPGDSRKIINRWSVYANGWCLWCSREHDRQMADPNNVPTGQGGW